MSSRAVPRSRPSGHAARQDYRRARTSEEAIAQRAIRAGRQAGLYDEPRASIWPFLRWLAARLLAIGIVIGAAWLLYNASTSAQFRVRSVRVTGAVLLSSRDVEDAAAVTGANIFWIDRKTAERRIGSLPLVERVVVSPVLPDAVEIKVAERTPAALWSQDGHSYLVDARGVVLQEASTTEQAAVAACAAGRCPTGQAPLPRISDGDATPIQAGSTVDPAVLATSAKLLDLLKAAGMGPSGFSWSLSGGLEAALPDGTQVRFSRDGSANDQIAALKSVQAYLAHSGNHPHVIDVRAPERPVYE